MVVYVDIAGGLRSGDLNQWVKICQKSRGQARCKLRVISGIAVLAVILGIT